MDITSILHLLLAALLLAIVIIDLRQQIIPDTLNTLLAWLGVFHLAFLWPIIFWWWYAISMLALGGLAAFLAGPYSRLRGRAMLGWGDVKFFAAAGLWIPFMDIGLFLALAGFFGVVASLIYRRKTGRAETPFAPALCLSLWLVVTHSALLNDYAARFFTYLL